jgi:cell division protein FtsB
MQVGVNLKEHKKEVKKYSLFLAIFLVLFFLVTLGRNILKISEDKKKIEETKKRIEKLKEENKELNDQLTEVKSREYIEKELRDKLGLVKEGETVVVLPDKEILGKIVPKTPDEEEVLPDPIWKKWAKLFF